MLPLFQTLIDIVFLRKGPESIPRAGVMFVMVLLLWLFSSLVALALVDHINETVYVLTLFVATIGLMAYALLVIGFGGQERVLQTISAILGCGALITFAYVAVRTLLSPFAGNEAAGLMSQVVAWWGIPVEGHIIARAIDQRWYVGFVIAFGIYVFQIMVYVAIAPERLA